MSAHSAIFLLLAMAPVGLDAIQAREREAEFANPIRKVVTMLQKMKAKVEADGEREEELYHKFMCYCQTSGGDLKASIDAAEQKIDSLGSEIKSATEKKAQTEQNLKEHQDSRAKAGEAMKTATKNREKEAAAFAIVKSDSETNIAAVKKAVAALEKGMAGSFLQSTVAQTLRSATMDMSNMDESARQEVLSFLSGTQGEGYAPAGGEITGILKTMDDEMTAGLKEATEAENKAIAAYEGLMAAKKKEVAALSRQIEKELKRIGDLGVFLAGASNDLEDTTNQLAEDKTFVADLAESCKTKTAEWEEIKKTRAAELLALADTIKVLNDDDALELFKKTLPTPAMSFVQVKVSDASARSKALGLVRAVHNGGPALDFIALALNGKKIGFDKVIKMIDDLVAELKTEQVEDNQKKEYCAKEFDLADDKKKSLERAVSDSATAIEEMKGSIATLIEEINALNAGIRALDKSVAEATEQRREDNQAYKELIANNAAAKELMMFAKNRLNKFYNPKLYKAPAKRELSEEERITVNMGGKLAPTDAPGGIAGTGIAVGLLQLSSVQSKAAPPPPPETFGAYTKKSEENTGVIAMIDLLIADLDKETTESETEEKDAQADYEKLMAQAGKKRAQDSKSVTDKSATKAQLQGSLEEEEESKASSEKELGATLQYIHSLHGECDWLVKYFEVRKTARTDEIDALGKARAVLSGADYA